MFQLEALVALQREPAKPDERFDDLGGDRVYRYATAVVMGESCVGCHNSRADSPRHGWKVGDVRGAQEVIIPVRETSAIISRQLLESSALFALTAGLAVLLMTYLMRGLRRALSDTRAMTSMLENKNLELSAAKADAERASRAKSEFLATVSHELRTPLNAILGFSEIMERERLGPIGTPKYREFASEVHASGTHLLDIINDILDMSKIEAGKLELRVEEVIVSDVIDACARMMRNRAERAGQLFEIEAADGLPSLSADPRALKQILLNLLSNAIKFTPEGGRIALTVRVEPPDVVRFEVSDTGIGIPSDQIPRILQPFSQVDSSLSRTHGGTGLGLPIAKALTDLHGGDLHIESTPSKGSTFIVRILARPLRRAAA